ncbi:uncharacterized protein LOC144440483 isoform X2 [Glandiceps talaboti]
MYHRSCVWILWLALSFTLTVDKSTGLSCYSCDRKTSHSTCNVEGVVQCNEVVGEDGCYTESERYEHFGKRDA